MADQPLNNAADLFADDFTRMILQRVKVSVTLAMLTNNELQVQVQLYDAKQRHDGTTNPAGYFTTANLRLDTEPVAVSQRFKQGWGYSAS
jgi:hypothetical protein